HADQTFVLDDAAVQDHAVADGDAISDQAGNARVGVHHREILHVRPFADADALGIAPDDRVIPDAGAGSDLDVSQNNGAGRDEGGWIDHCFLLQDTWSLGTSPRVEFEAKPIHPAVTREVQLESLRPNAQPPRTRTSHEAAVGRFAAHNSSLAAALEH